MGGLEFLSFKLSFLEVKLQWLMISISTGLGCPNGGVIAGSPHQEVKGEDCGQTHRQGSSVGLVARRVPCEPLPGEGRRHPRTRLRW